MEPGGCALDDVTEDARTGAASAGSVRPARGDGNHVEQRLKSGDVMAVYAGQRYRERYDLSIDDEVVLAARPCAVDRARVAFGPRRAASMCEESITARHHHTFGCFS